MNRFTDDLLDIGGSMYVYHIDIALNESTITDRYFAWAQIQKDLYDKDWINAKANLICLLAAMSDEDLLECFGI